MSSVSPALGFTQFTDEAIRLVDFHYRGQFTNQGLAKASTRPEGDTRHSWKQAAPLEQMDWQPTISNQGGTQKRQAKWVTQAEIQRRRENKLCVRCGARSHFVLQYPYLSAQPPSPIRAARATAEPLLEELLPAEPQSENE